MLVVFPSGRRSVVESGYPLPTQQTLSTQPQSQSALKTHPYTHKLLNCIYQVSLTNEARDLDSRRHFTEPHLPKLQVDIQATQDSQIILSSGSFPLLRETNNSQNSICYSATILWIKLGNSDFTDKQSSHLPTGLLEWNLPWSWNWHLGLSPILWHNLNWKTS